MAPSFIVTFLLAASLVASAQANVLPNSALIVGGAPARSGQFPYAASLQLPGNRHFCGAAIVHQRWVLTAASCVEQHWAGSFTVRTGTHLSNVGGVTHQVSSVVLHPNYSHGSRANDIALVQTATAIAQNAQTRLIALPRQANGAVGQAVVVGWGRRDVSGPNTPQLQFLNTATMTHEACRTALATVGQQGFLRQTNVCTLTFAGGVCRGDSGAPLAVGGELVGLLSFGMSCATGSPDVFTRVHSYVEWIGQNMR